MRPRCGDTGGWKRWSLCALLLPGIFVASLPGCRTPVTTTTRHEVDGELTSRFGAGIGEERPDSDALVPAEVLLDDGISEDEAVHVALSNNAAFQQSLTQLGISTAQLLDAGLISDPQFTLFFPLGPKQLEFTAFQAVDLLWLQPIRVRSSELDLDQVSQSLVQNGLDVIRDVRAAHSDLILAADRETMSQEASSLRAEIAELAQKRLAAGDVSELEATASRIDALQAKAAAERAPYDVTLARERLRVLLGLTMFGDQLTPERAGDALPIERSLDDLLHDAIVQRPDLRAAEIAVETAGERAGLARNQFMNLEAVYDANGSGSRGFESGPGLRMTLPIFNHNQGGIAIADARWQQAARQYVAVRDRIVLDVRTSHTQLAQARENLATLRTEILPTLRTAEELARRNFQNGGATYLVVLQTTSQYIDARLRELELKADIRRAIAELDRAVGHRVCLTQTTDPAIAIIPAPATSAMLDSESDHVEIIRTTGWRATTR